MAKHRLQINDFVKQEQINYYQARGQNDIHVTSTNGLDKKELKEGMVIFFIATATNTGPITIGIDNLDPVKGLNYDGKEFKADDIKNEAPYQFLFDGFDFRLVSGGGVCDDPILNQRIKTLEIEVTTLETGLAETNEKLKSEIVEVESRVLLGQGINLDEIEEYDPEMKYEDGITLLYNGHYSFICGGELCVTDYTKK